MYIKKSRNCVIPGCRFIALIGKMCGPCKEIEPLLETKRVWIDTDIQAWILDNMEYVTHHRIRVWNMIKRKPVDNRPF